MGCNDGRMSMGNVACLAIVKMQLHVYASLYTCLQIPSVSVFEESEGSFTSQADRSLPESIITANRLNFFDF